MRLASVRDLKAELLTEIRTARAAVHGARVRRVIPLRFAAPSLQHPAPIALGIQKRGNDYTLAVRVQEVFAGSQRLLEHIRQRARGEVDVRLVGYVHKQAAGRRTFWYQTKQRPLLAGLSIGHFAVTAGTLGCFVIGRGTAGRVMLLSNNHVLANENNARTGDSIIQPGPADFGQHPADTIGHLAKFVRLKRRGNAVDAAIATLADAVAYHPAPRQGLKKLAGIRQEPLDMGELVYKVGRTTGRTEGRISAIEVDISIGYDMGFLEFTGQIEVAPTANKPFSQGGDSGALIVDGQYRAVGLLIAGNDDDVTYANPIQAVLDALNIQLVL
jgi:hypothetical protein